ncbi:Uma2 family endonuclease [Nocardiopsis flavescens]|uniref:Uma2 family endonuclease n=1 Tax=Nocardiopsis flavescens TaxID=758803 RepID=UPI00364C9591
MCAQPVPDRLIPPPGGFRAEDLDRLPVPPRTELLDGSLFPAGPRKASLGVLLDVLVRGLRSCAPPEYRVRRQMTVTLGPHQRPEPDLMLVQASAVDEEQTDFAPASVVLAAEIVSPESVDRDRVRKPQLYAEAGIPHFWRIEKKNGDPVVYVYELDPATNRYIPSGLHRNRLKVDLPYSVDIDLTEYRRL